YLQPDPRLRRGVHTALPSWPPGFNGGVFYRKSYFLGLRTEPSIAWRAKHLYDPVFHHTIPPAWTLIFIAQQP
ncbi:hypothetical protein, partial [Pseudomonas sp. MF5691]|uniref:hypothetical protein n=1 Tax=Pseudomonas sp. MF5691 TaxID=2797526 RepID=UPI001E57D925